MQFDLAGLKYGIYFISYQSFGQSCPLFWVHAVLKRTTQNTFWLEKENSPFPQTFCAGCVQRTQTTYTYQKISLTMCAHMPKKHLKSVSLFNTPCIIAKP